MFTLSKAQSDSVTGFLSLVINIYQFCLVLMYSHYAELIYVPRSVLMCLRGSVAQLTLVGSLTSDQEVRGLIPDLVEG